MVTYKFWIGHLKTSELAPQIDRRGVDPSAKDFSNHVTVMG